MATTAFIDYYKVLEIERTASMGQIREAISVQRRTWVKRQQAPKKETQREAEDRVKAIDEAQRVLLDPAKRRQYDAELADYRPPVETGANHDGSNDWLERAKQFLDQGDGNSAAYAARQATEQHGANHEAWWVRARADALVRHDADAAFEFAEAIRIKPNEPNYHFDFGEFHESRSNWPEALRSYSAASNLAPEVPWYRMGIASVYLNTNRASQALPIMERIHAECPDEEDCTIYYAWALSDTVLDSWTRLKNGSFIITKPEQIVRTREVLNKAKALKFHEPDLRAQIEANLRVADAAEKIKFRLPGIRLVGEAAATDGSVGAMFVAFGAVIFFWIGIPAIAFTKPAIGVLVTALWGFAFYKLAFQPAWKRTDHDTKDMQVPGSGIVPPRTSAPSPSPAPRSTASGSTASGGDSSGWL